MIAFELEPFRAAWWVRGAHQQTIAGNLLRKRTGVLFRRERIPTPDGDFVDLDFPQVIDAPALPDHAPVVLALHGLEGGATVGHLCELYRCLAQVGVRAVGLNFRSCSGELNQTARLYHIGETEDVALIHCLMAERYPAAPKAMIGFSLGANVLLRYLGDLGEQSGVSDAMRVRAAAVISVPFDLALASQKLESEGAFYRNRFLRKLKRKTLAKAHLLDQLDVPRILAATSLREFDAAFTIPIYGFDSVDHFYDSASSKHALNAIRVPTLLMRALDDPFMDASDVPYAALRANPFLVDGITPLGGHTGYVEPRGTFWAERQAARFVAAVLQRETDF